MEIKNIVKGLYGKTKAVERGSQGSTNIIKVNLDASTPCFVDKASEEAVKFAAMDIKKGIVTPLFDTSCSMLSCSYEGGAVEFSSDTYTITVHDNSIGIEDTRSA